MNEEIWRPVLNYNGIFKNNYEVSNLGNVRSLNYHLTGKTKNLKVKYSRYVEIELSTQNRKYRKHTEVHRLVYYSFHPERNEDEDKKNGLQVNHINENTYDNRLENLNLLTAPDNVNWGTRNERVSKKILQYDLNGNFIREWSSAIEIERQLGFCRTGITYCCKNKRKTAYGYIWKYKEE